MNRRNHKRERKSPIVRAARRFRKAVNRIQLGPDVVAAMVLVFAGFSFAAGLVVGTSKGAGAAEPPATAPTPQSSSDEQVTDRAATWLHQPDAPVLNDAGRAPAVADPLTDPPLFDWERFAETNRSQLPAAPPRLDALGATLDAPIKRDSPALEEPLLPPR
jgi:hypothetical protein